MKKIMFDDNYSLTEAVLEGRKTMTRRIVKHPEEVEINGHKYLQTEKLRYKVGEVVAVAQRYSELSWDKKFYAKLKGMCTGLPQKRLAGWDNKMFVKADLMPHRIRITNVRIERLQDISDEGCLREGIIERTNPDGFGGIIKDYTFDNAFGFYYCPQEAFSALINRVSGKGTWKSNPYVFVYEFKLIR